VWQGKIHAQRGFLKFGFVSDFLALHEIDPQQVLRFCESKAGPVLSDVIVLKLQHFSGTDAA